MSQEIGEQQAESWSKKVLVASQWTEGRGWLRFHIGFPERTEALMQSLAGFHQVAVWEEAKLRQELAGQFGENVDPLRAIRIVLAAIDTVDLNWRNAESANMPFGGTTSTVDFVDYLLRQTEQLPFNESER